MYLWMIIAALAAAGINLIFGRWEFLGFDLSPLIDSGWRVLNGQIPNVDFICTFPASAFLAVTLAYRVFGVHWISIILAEDLLYLLLCGLGLRLCSILASEKKAGPGYSLPWIYIGAQSIALLSVGHLWHSTTASAFAAYAILATCTLLCTSSHRLELGAHLAFAFAVLLLSKPNTAWLAVLLCMACLLLARRCAVAGCAALGGAALADLLVLSVFHQRPADVLRGYAGLSGRAIPRLFLVGIEPMRSRAGEVTVTITYLLLLLPVFRMLQIAWRDRADVGRSPAELLCLGAGLVTLVGLGTNFDIKVVDVPPLLVGAALLSTINPARFQRIARPTQLSIALLCMFALAVGGARLRMKANGPWAGSAYGKSVWFEDSFFGKFRSRTSFVEMLHQVDGVVTMAGNKRIFFGPRMEFLYAREGLPSPLHLPLWWHPGTSYPVAREASVEKSWVDHNFDVLIFEKKDRILFPTPLIDHMAKEFSLDASRSQIDVFYRKPAPGTSEASRTQ